MGTPEEHKHMPMPTLQNQTGMTREAPSDANLLQLRYTLECAIELSNKMGLGMMSYLISMAGHELEDIMGLGSEQLSEDEEA